MLISLALVPLALGATATATNGDLTATLTAPDSILPGQAFDFQVYGFNAAAGSFGVFSYSVLVDGVVVDASGFEWGNELDLTLSTTLDEGDHTLGFVFGDRNGGHGYYDVVVELDVSVANEGYCDLAWLPPTSNSANAGRMLPLKFEAYDCDTATLANDTDVVVTILDGGGVAIESWVYTGNPNTGVDIGSDYHVNWSTPSDAGDYTVVVTFSTGDTLERTFTLH